jgi:hypothetical protein
MERKTPPRRRQAAARALAEGRFRQKIVKSRKLYTRKGRVLKGSGPFDSGRQGEARSLPCVGYRLGPERRPA